MKAQKKRPTSKRNKGDIDWSATLELLDQAALIRIFTAWFDRVGVDGLYATLTPEQREEALRRLQAESDEKKHAARS